MQIKKKKTCFTIYKSTRGFSFEKKEVCYCTVCLKTTKNQYSDILDHYYRGNNGMWVICESLCIIYVRSAKYLDTIVPSLPLPSRHAIILSTIVVAPSRVVSVAAEIFDPEIFSEITFTSSSYNMYTYVYTTRACEFAVSSRNVDVFYII